MITNTYIDTIMYETYKSNYDKEITCNWLEKLKLILLLKQK